MNVSVLSRSPRVDFLLKDIPGSIVGCLFVQADS